MTMVGYILSALLAMMPLPGLTNLPNGAEVRVVSPDLRTVYLFWRVEKGTLKLQAEPLEIPDGSRVRLLIRVGRKLHAYEGRYLEGDIYVEAEDGYISVKQTFADVYHVSWPDPVTSFKNDTPSSGNWNAHGGSDQSGQNGAGNGGGSTGSGGSGGNPGNGGSNGGGNGGSGGNNGNGHKGGRNGASGQSLYLPDLQEPELPNSAVGQTLNNTASSGAE